MKHTHLLFTIYSIRYGLYVIEMGDRDMVAIIGGWGGDVNGNVRGFDTAEWVINGRERLHNASKWGKLGIP